MFRAHWAFGRPNKNRVVPIQNSEASAARSSEVQNRRDRVKPPSPAGGGAEGRGVVRARRPLSRLGLVNTVTGLLWSVWLKLPVIHACLLSA